MSSSLKTAHILVAPFSLIGEFIRSLKKAGANVTFCVTGDPMFTHDLQHECIKQYISDTAEERSFLIDGCKISPCLVPLMVEQFRKGGIQLGIIHLNQTFGLCSKKWQKANGDAGANAFQEFTCNLHEGLNHNVALLRECKSQHVRPYVISEYDYDRCAKECIMDCGLNTKAKD